MVAKLDRLSRSLLDFAALMEDARTGGWSLVILDVGVDTTSPSGEMIANVMATFAQFERRLIGQRTKDALAVKKGQGVRLGRPRSIGDDVIARIEEERAAGKSLRAIAEGLNEEKVPTAHGGRQWHTSTVREPSADPRITGSVAAPESQPSRVGQPGSRVRLPIGLIRLRPGPRAR